MNILIINHYAGSKKHGMEYRPYYLGKEWIKSGNNISIAASSFSHVRFLQPDIKNEFAAETIDGIKYYWIKSPRYKGNGIKRFINILCFIIGLFRYSKIIKKDIKPDIIIASSTYPLDILPAFRLSKMTGALLVYEVHDLWPLSLIELGNMSKYHPMILLFQFAENFAYRKSDKVISILPNAFEYMKQHGLKNEKFIYVPNGINVDDWNEAENFNPDKIEELQKLKNNGQFLIAYAGAHGIANALSSFVEAASKIRNLSIKFILIGDGPEKAKLKSLAMTLNLDNIIFIDPVSRKSIPKLLSIMDVLYISLQNQPLFKYGISPNKLLDYMMAGKPIIQAINTSNDIVTKAGCGVTIEAENVDAIVKAIVNLYNKDAREKRRMGLAGREYVIKFHSYDKLASKLLDSVTGNKL